MIDPRLVDYIKKAKKAGQTDEQIKSILLENGWNEDDMADIFKNSEDSTLPSEPQIESEPEPKPEAEPNTQSEQRLKPRPDFQPEARLQSEPQIQLQSQPQPQPQSMQSSALRKTRRHPALKLFIVLIVAIILGAGGLVFAYHFFNFPWNFLRPSPESVISKAWNNLKTINSQNFDSELLLSSETVFANNQSDTFNLVAKASGGIDANNRLSLIKASITGSTVNSNTSNEYDFFLSGEARTIQKDLYVILESIDLGGFEDFIMMFGGLDANEIKEKWFRFQLDEMVQEQLMKQTSVISGQQVDAEKEINDLTNKIAKILLDKKVYNINELEENLGVDGKEYHYQISLNREKLIEVSPEIFNILIEYRDKYNLASTPEYNSSEFTLEHFQKYLNEILDIVGDMNVDLFIGKEDNFFHKVQFVKNLRIDDVVIKINYKIETTGINNPIQVSIPNEYKDFKDAVPYFKIKASIKQMSFVTQQVCIANKNCYSVCKNGLLNSSQKTYGEALASFNEMIINQGGTNPLCFSGAQNYCISTQLADGSWLCVADGKLGEIKCESAKTICE